MGFTLLEDTAEAPPLPPKGKFALLDEGVEPAPKAKRFLGGPEDRAAIEKAVAPVARQVGLTARAGVKGVTAIPNMVGDALGMHSSGSTDALLRSMGLPEPETAIERVSGDVAGGMAGQGALAKLGSWIAQAGPQTLKYIGELMQADKGLQVASAGTASAAASTTREMGGGPVAQLAAGVAGAVVPSVATMVRPRGTIPQRQQDVIDTAAQHDVPLTYSDITGKGKRLDSWLEGTPFVGTAKFREQGSQKVTTAAERVVAGARDELDTTNFRGMAQVKSAAASGDKAAQRIVDDVANAGDDWQKIMQASGNMKLWRAREAADQLYTRVEKLSGGNSVPLTKTQLALDDAIAAETSSKLPDKTLLGTLKEMKTNIDQKPTDFSSARGLRSDLGKIIANKYSGENALVGAKGTGQLASIQAALEGDMEQFATGQGGQLERAWRRADDFYKTAVVPYKDKALAKALTSDTPDEVYSQFVRVGRSGAGEDRAVKFYDALDPKGKSAVRYGMLSNAMDDAAIAGKDTISPARFSASLEKIAPARGVFFEGEDKKALDGFVNLMRHAERFGQYSENPPTGQRVIPMISILGAAAWPKLAAAIGGSSLVAREATTRPALRDALIRASNSKLGQVEMQKLAEDVAKVLPATSAQSAAPQEPKQ